MFKEYISPEGDHIYRSKAELSIAPKLSAEGIEHRDAYLPVPYQDADGEQLTGKSDFYDPLLHIYVELKTRLNSRTTKRMASRAVARLLSDPFLSASSKTFKLLDNQWHHAAASVSAKQKAMHAAGHPFATVFPSKPPESTEKLLRKYDIAYLVYGSQEWRQLSYLRTLAAVPGITLLSFNIGAWAHTLAQNL